MENNTTKKVFNYNFLSVGMIYLISLIYIFEAQKIKDPESKMFPYMVCGFAIVMATLLLIRTYKKMGIHTKLPDFTGTRQAMVMAALLFGYVGLIELIGFYLATPIYIYISMLVLGQRKQKLIIAIALLTSLGCWLFFKLLLDMEIPLGMMRDVRLF